MRMKNLWRPIGFARPQNQVRKMCTLQTFDLLSLLYEWKSGYRDAQKAWKRFREYRFGLKDVCVLRGTAYFSRHDLVWPCAHYITQPSPHLKGQICTYFGHLKLLMGNSRNLRTGLYDHSHNTHRMHARSSCTRLGWAGLASHTVIINGREGGREGGRPILDKQTSLSLSLDRWCHDASHTATHATHGPRKGGALLRHPPSGGRWVGR